jgi:hypothetical protein
MLLYGEKSLEYLSIWRSGIITRIGFKSKTRS